MSEQPMKDFRDWHEPIGPAECQYCRQQGFSSVYHWPHQCDNTPEKVKQRKAALAKIISEMSRWGKE